jgi:hypothetical protein
MSFTVKQNWNARLFLNVLLLGNSGTGKTHIALALGLAACQRGHRVRFTTASALVSELIEARDEKKLLRFQKSTPQAKPLAKAIASNRQHGPTQHGYGPHPRTETKGIDRVLEKRLVQKAESRLKKMEGTPGFPNQRLSLAVASEEQVAYEHFNARRADESEL